MVKYHRIGLIRVALATLIFLIAHPIKAKEFFNKALWVVRDHITSKSSIDEIIQFAETNSYNVLFSNTNLFRWDIICIFREFNGFRLYDYLLSTL